MDFDSLLEQALQLVNNYKLLTFSSILIILILILKMKKKNPQKEYKKIKNLLKKDFNKGLKRTKKIEDAKIKAKLILEGKELFEENEYKILKKELVLDGIAKDLLKELLKDKEETKIKSCQALIELDTAESIDYAITALYDQNDKVKREVILALAKIPNDKIINTLASYVEYCDNQSILLTLGQAFEEIGIAAFDHLVDIALAGHKTYRPWAVKLLSRMKVEKHDVAKIIDIFIELSNAEDKIVRIHAIKALTQFKDEKNVFEHFLTKLDDPEYEVRSQVVKSLGDFAQEDAIANIAPLIIDSSGVVRMHAYQTLLKLGDKGIEIVIKAAKADQTKEEALKILTELDIEFLLKAIDNIYSESSIEDQSNKELLEDLDSHNNEKTSDIDQTVSQISINEGVNDYEIIL